MAKSAINSLQELTVKQGYIPEYNFTYKKVDETIKDVFTCHVSCKQLKACGTGSSKKEAKHNAAKNMLLLLDTNNTIPLPKDTSSSSVANVTQSPAKICDMSSLCKQSTVDRNYIGLLQEFCQQQKISTKDILYELVCEEESSQLKTFTIEVSVGSLRERATGYCKKIAKQEAAKKLLLCLNPAIANTNVANPNTVDLDGVNPNTANSNVTNTNILLDVNKLDIYDKKILENKIKKLGTEIIDHDRKKETLAIAELSEKAKSRYLECKTSDKSYKKVDQEVNLSTVKNHHLLFEKNYFSKFPYTLREKMRIIRDNYTDQMNLQQIKWDIKNSLKVQLQQIIVCNKTKNHIICLRLLSKPCITQFGMGDTEFEAESRATYNLIKTILIFLNV